VQQNEQGDVHVVIVSFLLICICLFVIFFAMLPRDDEYNRTIADDLYPLY